MLTHMGSALGDGNLQDDFEASDEVPARAGAAARPGTLTRSQL